MSDMDCGLGGAENECEWCHGNRPPANVVAPPCHRCHGTGRIDGNGESTAFGWPYGWRCKRCGGTGSRTDNVDSPATPEATR